MLMPYLILYRLSKWFSLEQGKLSQPKQYLTLEFTIFSQFLIRHVTRTFDLRLSSPRHPGHGFLSLVYATQRRQFIPQGAISFVEIGVIFFELFGVMSRSRRGYVNTHYLSPQGAKPDVDCPIPPIGPSALLAVCVKAFMKCHNATGFAFLERQNKNVLLRNAVNNQVRGTSEAEPFVVARISHEDAALCTQ